MKTSELISVLLKLFGLYWYVQALSQLSMLAFMASMSNDTPFYKQPFWLQMAIAPVIYILVGSFFTLCSNKLAKYFLGANGNDEGLHFEMKSTFLCVAYSSIGLWLLVCTLVSAPDMMQEFFIAYRQRGTAHPGFWALHSYEVLVSMANILIGAFLLFGNRRLAIFVSKRYNISQLKEESDAT